MIVLSWPAECTSVRICAGDALFTCEKLRRAIPQATMRLRATSASARMRASKRGRVECSGMPVVLLSPVCSLVPLSDDDDELNINPPTPCQIGKRPPASKPKENWPAFRASGSRRCTQKSLSVGRFMSFLRVCSEGLDQRVNTGDFCVHSPAGHGRPYR